MQIRKVFLQTVKVFLFITGLFLCSSCDFWNKINNRQEKSIVQLTVDSADARSAYPVLPETVYYTVSAEAANHTTVTKTSPLSQQEKNVYQLELESADWKIIVKGFSDSSRTTEILYGTKTVTVGTDGFYQESVDVNFIKTDENNVSVSGSVNLSVNVSGTNIDSVTVSGSGTTLDGTYTKNASGIISLEAGSVPAGDYSVNMKFYSADDEFVTFVKEQISVRGNMSTKDWYVSDSGYDVHLVKKTGAEDNASDFILTNEIIRKINNTSFFVKASDGSVIDSEYTGSDTNTGSWASPFATVQAAVDAAYQTSLTGVENFKIYIDGNITSAGKVISADSENIFVLDFIPLTAETYLKTTGSNICAVELKNNVRAEFSNFRITGNIESATNLKLNFCAVEGNITTEKYFTLNTSNVTGNMNVKGNISFIDSAVTGELTGSGEKLSLSGSTIDGNASFTGAVEFKEESKTSNVNYDGNLTVTGNFSASENTIVSGKLTVTGAINAGNEMSVGGDVHTDSSFTAGDSLYITGTLEAGDFIIVGKNAVIESDVTSNGTFTATESLHIKGNFTSEGLITTADDAHIEKNLTAKNGIKTGKNLYVEENCEINGYSEFGSEMIVSGNLTVKNNASTDAIKFNKAGVGGNVTFDSTAKEIETTECNFGREGKTILINSSYKDTDSSFTGTTSVTSSGVNFTGTTFTGECNFASEGGVYSGIAQSGGAVTISKPFTISSANIIAGENNAVKISAAGTVSQSTVSGKSLEISGGKTEFNTNSIVLVNTMTTDSETEFNGGAITSTGEIKLKYKASFTDTKINTGYAGSLLINAESSFTGTEVTGKVVLGADALFTSSSKINGDVTVKGNKTLRLKGTASGKTVTLKDGAKIVVQEIDTSSQNLAAKIIHENPAKDTYILEKENASGSPESFTDAEINRFILNNPGYYLEKRGSYGVIAKSGITVNIPSISDYEIVLKTLKNNVDNTESTYADGEIKVKAEDVSLTTVSFSVKDSAGKNVELKNVSTKIYLGVEMLEGADDNSISLAGLKKAVYLLQIVFEDSKYSMKYQTTIPLTVE